jgi:hypothetical protein
MDCRYFIRDGEFVNNFNITKSSSIFYSVFSLDFGYNREDSYISIDLRIYLRVDNTFNYSTYKTVIDLIDFNPNVLQIEDASIKLMSQLQFPIFEEVKLGLNLRADCGLNLFEDVQRRFLNGLDLNITNFTPVPNTNDFVEILF